MLLAEGSYGVRRKRPGEDFGGEADAVQSDLTGESKPLTPPLTATSANGPIARVPAPQIGAPGPVLKAPEPIATPQAPQSVAGIALGTSAPKVNMAPTATPGQPPAGPTPQVGAPAPIQTLSGEWTPPTASAQSAPLIASAAGGTMTPQGDASNPFKGYETDQGGKFGGYDSVPLAGDAKGRTFKQYDQDFVTNARSLGLDKLPPIDPRLFTQMYTANNNLGEEIKDKIANGQPVTDLEKQYIARARGMELQQDTAAPTFGTFGTKEGTTTAKDPAEQARLLEQMRTGAIPSGPAPQVGAPPGVTAPPSKVNTTTAGPAGGGGGAPAVGVGPSGTPAFPSTPSPSVGSPRDVTDLDPVQQAMRDETLRRLQNPSPYDDALWKREEDRARLSHDEQWKRERDNLDADLAARNINWSSIAGDKFSDFRTAKGRAWDDVLTGFLSDRAKGIGSARDQAFNAGQTERTYYDDQRQRGIDNQFDVTRLAEALRQGREGTAIDWTRLGLGALGTSADNSADLGAGAAASAGQTGTGDFIAKWLEQYYGKRVPKPGVGAPAPAMAGAYG